MNSLLEKEGMRGKVQTIYIDPPYGIKFGSNWQVSTSNRNVNNAIDDFVRQPEQVKAFRDTWELGIHSYLSYLRDRLIVARELLNESGSCFVQISDENVNLVRNIIDEVFGNENYVALIPFKKTAGKMGGLLDVVNDYLVFYAKEKPKIKYRQLYELRSEKSLNQGYTWIELESGERRRLTSNELGEDSKMPNGRRFITAPMISQSGGENSNFPIEFEGKTYRPSPNTYWKTNFEGIQRLIRAKRIIGVSNTLAYVRYEDDFPVVQITNFWSDTQESTFAVDKKYIVQTAQKVIQRCLLMTTDPGDIVLDPTCGSGMTAYVAEQWGRRWITIDTSRVALAIARTRMMTAKYPFYKLKDEYSVSAGFEYETVPHITLKSLANDEEAEREVLYDKPLENKKIVRVAGPFTVESLSPHRVSDAAGNGQH